MGRSAARATARERWPNSVLLSMTETAARLSVSVKTVSTHKANMMQKLSLHNQSELVRYAIRHGLAEPLEPFN